MRAVIDIILLAIIALCTWGGYKRGLIGGIAGLLAIVIALFGGSLLAEQIFSYPGLGNATVKAATKGDVPLLLALAMFSAVFVFVGNLVANVLYGVLDPRIRQGEKLKNVK